MGDFKDLGDTPKTPARVSPLHTLAQGRGDLAPTILIVILAEAGIHAGERHSPLRLAHPVKPDDDIDYNHVIDRKKPASLY